MTTTAPDLVHTAVRIANGKQVFRSSELEVLDTVKRNPEILEALSEDERQVVEQALGILFRKFRVPSVPPPPSDPEPGPEPEPPQDGQPPAT